METGSKNRRLFPSLSVLFAAAFVTACVDQPTEPTGPSGPAFDRSTAPGQHRASGLDAEYAGIAERARGFGGMFYDENGTLNVYLTEEGRQSPQRALDEVAGSLQKRGRTAPSNSEIRILDASRDYVELVTLRSRMGNVLGVPGVVFTDIDEATNSLHLGVLESASVAQVQSALRDAGIPLDAVNIEITDPVVPVATLRDALNPLGGGLQIWRFIPPGSASICTLGFNVRLLDDNEDRYFFTNSHCTEVRGEVTGTVYRQGPLSLATRTVAFEVADPPFFSCQYPGYRCRWSDAALAQYYPDSLRPDLEVKLGFIWRTTAHGTTAPATLETDDKGFAINADRNFPIVGDVVDKIGRTTGWTRGPVTRTCVDTGVSGASPPIAMLCQDFVNAAVNSGDSGSPVFQPSGTKRDATLFGILWGGAGSSYVFSALGNIRAEFAAFRTH
jgi:hypothetical protein